MPKIKQLKVSQRQRSSFEAFFRPRDVTSPSRPPLAVMSTTTSARQPLLVRTKVETPATLPEKSVVERLSTSDSFWEEDSDDDSVEILDVWSGTARASAKSDHAATVAATASTSSFTMPRPASPSTAAVVRTPPTLPRTYSLDEFQTMWLDAERDIGLTTDDLEHGKLVRGANQGMSKEDSREQAKAQYGRLLPAAVETLLDTLEVAPEDVFCDIGHGIGSVTLQAAYTRGCEGRGIEVVADRHVIAETLAKNLHHQRIQLHHERDGRQTRVGKVRLRHGELQAPEQLRFLTQANDDKDPNYQGSGRVKAFCNNYNGVFSYGSAKVTQKYYLDDYLAGIFASMAPGSILVTLHPLTLGPTLDKANEYRQGRRPESADASFYQMEAIDFGEARHVASWSQGGGNTHHITGYKYTRTMQSSPSAIFLCSNPSADCPQAQQQIRQSAVTKTDDGKVVRNCCPCGFEIPNMRARKKVNYNED